MKILVFICNATFLRYFDRIIRELLRDDSKELMLLTPSTEWAELLHQNFPQTRIRVEYHPYIIDEFSPDILFTGQIWWWGIIPVLKQARSLNIPIFHYDHGAFMAPSGFILEHDEHDPPGYHCDITLCSHLSEWGEIPKNDFVSFGVLQEKLIITGAAHLDALYELKRSPRQNIRELLGIPQDKKIVFMYTCITGQIASLDQACINLLHHVEQFVENNPDFQLIVKPHTSEMLWFNHVRYEVSPKTIFIAHHTEDCAMERIVRINVDEVVHSSDVVISLSSSAMITPLILDIPLIHFEMDNHLCHDLAQTGKGAFYSISDPMTVGQAIQNAILNPLFGASKLAEKFNFKNDGKATGRIVEAIEQVIAERHKGRSFYTSIEEEFIECIKRYPFLPYPLKSLFEYYCSEGDIASAEEILNEYCQKFKDPTPLIKLLVSKCSTIGDTERILKNLILYNQYKPLTPELVHMYKMALLESDIKSAYGK